MCPLNQTTPLLLLFGWFESESEAERPGAVRMPHVLLKSFVCRGETFFAPRSTKVGRANGLKPNFAAGRSGWKIELVAFGAGI